MELWGAVWRGNLEEDVINGFHACLLSAHSLFRVVEIYSHPQCMEEIQYFSLPLTIMKRTEMFKTTQKLISALNTQIESQISKLRFLSYILTISHHSGHGQNTKEVRINLTRDPTHPLFFPL